MSENNSANEQDNATPESSSAPPAGETILNTDSTENAPESAPRGLRGSGLRYNESDNVPSWAVGKTADELLDISTQLYQAIQQQSPQQPQQTPTPQAQPTMSTGIPEVDHNLIYSDPAEYHRRMEARMDARIQAAIGNAAGGVTTPMASLAKTQAMSHRPEVWAKYGPEIETTMSSMAPEARANVDVWKRVVNYVAGEHVDEIARAKAEEIIARGSDSGMLSTQGGPPSVDRGSALSPIRKLFKDDHPAIRGFLDDHIPVEKVIEHGLKRGYTEEAYAEMLTTRAARRVGVAR